jgi:diguanylate cyclase (GGDEF)-like protein
VASILVVDDSEATRAQVRRALRGDATFDRFLEAEDGLSAFKLLVEEKPNLVLCDLNMPRFDGRGFLKLRASRADLRDIPVIMLAAEGDGELKARLIEDGACDYLTKPFHEKELLVRVRLHHRMKALQDELRDANARLEALSNTDPLTGLANRRCLERRLADEIARARRHGVPLTAVALDIDHFKSVNDKHGHDMGDVVLRNVARAMAEGLRSNDLAARPGGEEFLLLLPHTELAGGVTMAERVRGRLERLVHVGPSTTLRVTASFGVACTQQTATLPAGEELLARADRALYEAKRAGRNRVTPWAPPDDEASSTRDAPTLSPPAPGAPSARLRPVATARDARRGARPAAPRDRRGRSGGRTPARRPRARGARVRRHERGAGRGAAAARARGARPRGARRVENCTEGGARRRRHAAAARRAPASTWRGQ